MRKYMIAALFAAAAAAPAMAQPAAPFTGPRIEGLVGYDHVRGDGGGRDGVTYGVGVGYDFQLGGAVVGLEGEANDSSVDACENGFVTAADRICLNAKRDLYIGGRVGAVVGPRTLVYAKAGYTNARVGVNYDDGTAAGAGNFRLNENLDGVRVGAGIEHMLGRNTYVKAEYRYSNYEKGLERHQVVGGVGFRF